MNNVNNFSNQVNNVGLNKPAMLRALGLFLKMTFVVVVMAVVTLTPDSLQVSGGCTSTTGDCITALVTYLG